MLTYKVKHGRDFSEELRKAKYVAEFAINTKSNTSKAVKHFGLKSTIANQILRKYGRNKNSRRVKNVKLIVPSQGIKVNKQCRIISISCLKLAIHYFFPDFEKVNQVEVGEDYAHITVTISEPQLADNRKWIGVDLNTTAHVAVASNPETGKVLKLGSKALHIHKKYQNIRRRLQKARKYKKVKLIRNRQSRIIRNLNHHVSRRLVQVAKSSGCGIRLERLTNIRKTSRSGKSFRYALNSWSFYQLQKMIEYKAKLHGVVVDYIAPNYTSKMCSRCGHIGDRDSKYFKCPSCGHVDHADVNASFNIGKPVLHCILGIGRLHADRDVCKGSTDTPGGAPLGMIVTSELTAL